MSELQNSLDAMDSLMEKVATEGQTLVAELAAMRELADSRREMIEHDTATHDAEVSTLRTALEVAQTTINEQTVMIEELSQYRTMLEEVQAALNSDPQ